MDKVRAIKIIRNSENKKIACANLLRKGASYREIAFFLNEYEEQLGKERGVLK